MHLIYSCAYSTCLYYFQLDISIKLVSFEEGRVPNLERPYLCCKPTLSVKQLIQVVLFPSYATFLFSTYLLVSNCFAIYLQYVAHQTALQTEEVELYLVKECPANVVRGEGTLDPNNHICQFLSWEEETLAELIPNNLSCGHLVIYLV